jgi:integrase
VSEPKDVQALVIIEKTGDQTLAPLLAREVERATALSRDVHSAATLRAYRSARRRFRLWCEARESDPSTATPEIVAAYLFSMAETGSAVSSIEQAYAAIAGRLAEVLPDTWIKGVQPDIVRRALVNIRKLVRREVVRKRPVTRAWLEKMLGAVPADARGVRDRAILLIGYAGAFRRSEIVALDVEHLTFSDEGVSIRLRDKTHQQKDFVKGIPRDTESAFCPVAALERWLRGAKITVGAVFRRVRDDVVLDARLGDEAVALLVKRAVKAAGGNARAFGGHSLRAGFMTQGALDGWDLEALMRQSGHQSVEQARQYIRRETVFQHNAAATITSGKRKA